MTVTWLGVAAAIVALLGAGLLLRAEDTTIDDALARGTTAPAPTFDLDVLDAGLLRGPRRAGLERALEDGRLSLRELRGSPVVLNIWASWCEPCREEAPLLQAAWRRWRDRGVVVLGLDMQDTPDAARRFLDEFGVDYPNVRDPDDSTARDYGAARVPETFFLTAEGEVAAHAIGAVRADFLERGIRAARAGRPVTAGRTGPARPRR